MKKKSKSKVFYIIIGVLLIIQFPIFNPTKNFAGIGPVGDISEVYKIPSRVQLTLHEACYDCHSNYTQNYPWYYNIQPVSWWIARNISKGKKVLNFSEFQQYSMEERKEKMLDAIDILENSATPLKSYLWMHETVDLTEEKNKMLLIG